MNNHVDVIEKLFKAELNIKNAHKNSQNNLEKAYQQHLDAYIDVLKSNHNERANFIEPISLSTEIKIPGDILRKSSQYGQFGRIYNFDRNFINSFFKENFDLDVTSVEVIDSPTMPEHAEGQAFECGLDDHYVVISTQNGLYYDLIIHEFAHTVEFSERRKKYTAGSIGFHPMLTEAVAHYYQLIYLLEHGSVKNRLCMLASITEAYVFSRCARIMLKHAPNDRSFDFKLIFNDPEFKDIKDAFGGMDILPNLEALWQGKSYREEHYYHHGKRFGVFLALNCIKHNLDILELSKVEIPAGDPANDNMQYVSVLELLEQTNLNVDLLLDFSTMDDTITKFVNGTL